MIIDKKVNFADDITLKILGGEVAKHWAQHLILIVSGMTSEFDGTDLISDFR